MDLFESGEVVNEGKVVRVAAPDLSDDPPELLECCKRTIGMHAKNNPMMVCGECKKIIKVFDNDKAYRNYQRFCASRHRRFLATPFGDQHVVIFKNYDSYSA
ncbi:MAG: hypothetical protein M3Q07_17270 [Pseudobdellovibrionaceae bacterium]|jgi:hypothetical protein|uniref:hypothetical protein n=1 Tax=Oligoflexus TaxID=1553903 RepID=UPI00114CED60|nr:MULTISPECIES: hypothetical protein [Oligoflexus]MDQ3233571.1 hypothetical protein [Pseudobdellovibrionaceae bacterium]HYX32030.1 hypothetical protein [Oligoflexus sp.]